jgi:hypothetical protein
VTSHATLHYLNRRFLLVDGPGGPVSYTSVRSRGYLSKRGRTLPEVPSPEEVKALFQACTNLKHRTVMMTGYGWQHRERGRVTGRLRIETPGVAIECEGVDSIRVRRTVGGATPAR